MTSPQPYQPQVLYEDNHLIIINKKPGEIVQGDKTGDVPLSEKIKLYLKEKYHKPGKVFLGVTHRLDRPVSGAVIFARTDKSLSRLNEMLRDKQVRKHYWAIVKNAPPRPEDHLVHYLVRNQKQNKSYVYNEDGTGRQEAALIYKVIGQSDRFFLLEIELLSGRHHQIRAQLAHIGCPIRGDLKYGFPRSNPEGSISLHARKVEFVHPVNKQLVSVTADPPHDSLWDHFLLSL
jgi:23S rRNA pseudouridine1911/1915/1917 synthase